jgi:hypothetical protein
VDGWRDRDDVVADRAVPSPSATAASATAMLIRPDRYVAWASDAPDPDHCDRESLCAALTTWFGAAR